MIYINVKDFIQQNEVYLEDDLFEIIEFPGFEDDLYY
jgi:hypothetical protein